MTYIVLLLFYYVTLQQQTNNTPTYRSRDFLGGSVGVDEVVTAVTGCQSAKLPALALQFGDW